MRGVIAELLRTREEWRRTDLSGFSPDGWTEAEPSLFARGGDGLVKKLGEGDPFLTDLFSAGLSPLEEMVRERARCGFIVLIPPGTRVEEPIELRYGRGGQGDAFFHRAAVVLGEGAEATVVEWADHSPGGLWAAGLTEVRLGPGARLSYLGASRVASGTWSFWSRRAELGAGAELRWAVAEGGGRLLRRDDLVFLRGEESAVGAFYLLGSGERDSQADGGMTVEHEAPGTVSRLLVRALVGDGRVVFRGRGRMAPGTRGSRADQRARGLLLGGGRFDVLPALLIGEHEVEASHGAAASAPDEEELFYLASRGLEREKALALLVQGFARPVLELFPSSLRREVVDFVGSLSGLGFGGREERGGEGWC